jgi:hypothetical protein
VLAFDPAEIREVQITTGGQEIRLTQTRVAPDDEEDAEEAGEGNTASSRSETVWKTPDGKTGDQGTLNRLLSSLSSLRCTAFASEKLKERLADPVYAIVLQGNEAYTLTLYPKENDEATRYPGLSSGTPYPFFLSDQQAAEVMPEPKALLPEAEKAEKPEAETPQTDTPPTLNPVNP